MFPYLVLVLMDKALDKGMEGFNIDFAGAKNVSSECGHVANVIKEVETIVTEA